jgi:hypothetical protein
MTQPLQQLLAQASDFDLGDGVYRLLLDRYDDLGALPAEGKVVVWTWHAKGIIDNGGFQYLFEGIFETDPYYAGTLAAFRAIGAEQCAAALEEALQVFPRGKPPVDRDRRLRAWHRHGWHWIHPAVCRFWDESPMIPRLVAAYIRKNRGAFEQMIG